MWQSCMSRRGSPFVARFLLCLPLPAVRGVAPADQRPHRVGLDRIEQIRDLPLDERTHALLPPGHARRLAQPLQQFDVHPDTLLFDGFTGRSGSDGRLREA
jgi:hypothetical protein